MKKSRLTKLTVFLFCSVVVPGFVTAETIPVSLETCVGLALDANPDIAVTKSDLSKSLLKLKRSRGLYWPRLVSSLNYVSRTDPSVYETDTSGGSFLLTSTEFFYQTGIYETLPTGGEVFTNFSTDRLNSSSSNITIRPYYASNWEFGARQPLLAGFDWFGGRLGNSWNEYRVTRVGTKISEYLLRDSLSKILTDVEFAYWNLKSGRDTVIARKSALELTQQQLAVTKKKIEAGLVVAAEAYQVEERLASRRGAFLEAQREHLRAQIQLAHLLNQPVEKIEQTVISEDAPFPFDSYSFQRDEALGLLDQQNPALLALGKEVEARRLEMLRQKNLMMPKLDLSGSFFLNGGNTPLTSGSATGTYGDDLAELVRMRTRGWSIGMELEVPIGPRPGFQDYRIAQVDLRTAENRLLQETVRLRERLSELFAEIEAGHDLVDTANETLDLAKKKLSFEQEKFAAGLTTNFNLLQFQEDLTDARIGVIRSLVAYKKATTSADAITGRTLEKFRIDVTPREDRWTIQKAPPTP